MYQTCGSTCLFRLLWIFIFGNSFVSVWRLTYIGVTFQLYAMNSIIFWVPCIRTYTRKFCMVQGLCLIQVDYVSLHTLTICQFAFVLFSRYKLYICLLLNLNGLSVDSHQQIHKIACNRFIIYHCLISFTL